MTFLNIGELSLLNRQTAFPCISAVQHSLRDDSSDHSMNHCWIGPKHHNLGL